MLSGMNVKPAAVIEAEMQAFLDAGHTVTTIKARKVKPHWNRTKSHRFGGRFSRYNVGGNNRIATMRRAA